MVVARATEEVGSPHHGDVLQTHLSPRDGLRGDKVLSRREGGREGGREGEREGERERGREGGREGEREGEREGGKEGGNVSSFQRHMYILGSTLNITV